MILFFNNMVRVYACALNPPQRSEAMNIIIQIITYVIMFAGLLAVIWGIRNLNKTANGRVVMIIGAVVLFGGVIFNIIYTWPTKDKTLDRNEKKEAAFRMAKAEIAARYIAERFPDGRVAFLIDETSAANPESESSIVLAELKRLLGEKGLTCEEEIKIKVAEEDGDSAKKPKSSADPEEAFGKTLNSVLDKIKDKDKLDIVVNFIGMPKSQKGFDSVKFIQAASSTGKKNMLLMNDVGLDFVKQSMIENGRVSAIIEYTTEEGKNFNFEKDNVPKDPEKAFNLKYFFIKSDTLPDFNSMENDTYFINK